MAFVLSIASKLYMLNVIMLSIVMLNVVMLNVVAPMKVSEKSQNTIFGQSFFNLFRPYLNAPGVNVIKHFFLRH